MGGIDSAWCSLDNTRICTIGGLLVTSPTVHDGIVRCNIVNSYATFNTCYNSMNCVVYSCLILFLYLIACSMSITNGVCSSFVACFNPMIIFCISYFNNLLADPSIVLGLEVFLFLPVWGNCVVFFYFSGLGNISSEPLELETSCNSFSYGSYDSILSSIFVFSSDFLSDPNSLASYSNSSQVAMILHSFGHLLAILSILSF